MVYQQMKINLPQKSPGSDIKIQQAFETLYVPHKQKALRNDQNAEKSFQKNLGNSVKFFAQINRKPSEGARNDITTFLTSIQIHPSV